MEQQNHAIRTGKQQRTWREPGHRRHHNGRHYLILAAVIGTFVLGIAPDDDPAPNAHLVFVSGDEGEVDVRHQGGATLDTNDLSILINGSVSDESTEWGDLGPFSAGETMNITIDNGDASPGDEIEMTIRHDPSDSVLRSATVEVGDV